MKPDLHVQCFMSQKPQINYSPGWKMETEEARGLSNGSVKKKTYLPVYKDNCQRSCSEKSQGPKVDYKVLRGLIRGRVSVKPADNTALNTAKSVSTFT